MNYRIALAVCVIMSLLLGSAIGYVYGYASAIKWGVKIGKEFVHINVDDERIAEILIKYKRHIEQEFGHYG